MAITTTDPPSVLDLLVNRRHITVDGTRYELKNQEEFSLFDFRRMQRVGKRMNEIETIDEPSPEQEAEYNQNLNALTRLVLVAPDAVHDRLQPGQRQLISRAFFGLSLPRPQTGVADPETRPNSATTKSSPVSRGSTARRRRTG